MKKRVLRWCILLAIIPLLSAGTLSETDSLKAVLASSKEDTVRVNTLLALSRQYFKSAPTEAIGYAMKARDLSIKLDFRKGIAYALKNIGIAYYMQGKYLETLDFWHQSLEVFQSLKDNVGIANVLNNIGAVYFNKADDEKALEYYLKSLKISEQLGDKLRIATACTNIGAVYFHKKATQDKALEYYLRALPLSEELKNNDAIGTSAVNLGEIYAEKGDDKTALMYFEKSLKAYENSENIPYSLNNIGKLYLKRGDFASAIKYHQKAFDFSKQLNAKLDMTQSMIGLAKTYAKQGNKDAALSAFLQSMSIAREIEAHLELKEIYEGLANIYSQKGDYANAFKYQIKLLNIKDTLYNIETDKKLSGLQFNFDIQKKQGQIDLLTKDKALQALDLQKQKVIKNVTFGGLAMVVLFLIVVSRQKKKISIEKRRSEELLLNILPAETAEELKSTGSARAKSFEMISVMFTDFKNFTQASEKMTAEELVKEINKCYSEFDRIITKYGIEKIKTIGDSYMCAGGIPVPNNTHAEDLIRAGLEMQQFICKNSAERIERGEPSFDLRLGIHSGPVVAGIVGIKKFAYDIWGDTVNTASRMESSGEIGKVNISGCTYELVKDKFSFIYRGKIEAKHKGQIDMYFVSEISPS